MAVYTRQTLYIAQYMGSCVCKNVNFRVRCCKNILHFEMWVTFFAKKLPNSSGKPMNSKCQSKATRP